MSMRAGMFLFGCLPLRAALAYVAWRLSRAHLRLFSLPLLLVGGAFAYLYFAGARMDAPEGGGVTWWARYRLMHAALYLTAAVYALRGSKAAAAPLAIDVALGLVLWLAKN
jgi:hypothetical protein